MAMDPGREAQYAAETETLRVIGAPVTLARPDTARAPIIFTSPHSGAVYPESFTRRSDLSLSALRANEDAFVDRLFAPAAAIGAPLLCARFPRCFVDVNRGPDELPPHWGLPAARVTSRAEAGFGVIPLNIDHETPIYREPLLAGAARLRIEALYRPYHQALQGLIDECLAHFGRAVIIDCHSMPGFAALGSRRDDIVLGNRFGQSCAPRTTALFENAFRQCGYSVSRNYPYAGGFVTRHYGRSPQQPQRAVQTLQIEINRDLYLNSVTLAPKTKGYARLSRDIQDIIWAAIEGFGEARHSAAGARAAE